MVMGSLKQEAEVAIIGGGPGGYVAAIRAADLGKEVVLIDDQEKLGGVCLQYGCIPSKVLINVVELAESARNASNLGLNVEGISFDLDRLRNWKNGVVDKLSKGVESLVKRRGIEVIKGRARFDSNQSLLVEGSDVSGVEFKHCIIATGSRPRRIPPAEGANVWLSKDALEIPEVPDRLLVVGGGYIGLELGLVYAGLGSKITMVDFMPRLLMGADFDLVKVMMSHAESRFEKILYESKVTKIEEISNGFVTTVEHEGKELTFESDRVLTAVGRLPNTDDIGLENTAITLDDRGFIPVSEENKTAETHIYAIGDVTPGPMLAHKASREAHVAAEVIANYKSAFDNRAIPAVVFTDPEIAWSGLTEREAEEKGIKINVGKFPLRALGRAQTIGRTDGLVKIISDPESKAVLGVGMVGPHASELISEGTLAIEMGATLEDIIVTIHPHPTLSEAIMEAAEVAAGEAVHIPPAKEQQ